jgi:NADH-quinone oxidoreductase subunit A
VFILFDVEAIFLYPWALIFKELAHQVATRWYIFIIMMLYLDVLVAGYTYLWKKGALDWNKPKK